MRKILMSTTGGFGSGMLLYFSFFNSFAWFSFFSLVPILLVIVFTKSKRHILLSALIFLAIWLIPHCSILYNYPLDIVKKISGWVLVIVIAIKLLPFLPFFFQIKYRIQILLFCLLWLTMDAVWLRWALQVPFFTLSIPLGAYPKLIQWFQITGILGGSLWLLLINLLLCDCIVLVIKTKHLPKRQLVFLFLIFMTPAIYSLYLYSLPEQNMGSRTVKIISYSLNQKGKDAQEKCLNYLRKDTSNCDYTLFPEMTLQLINEPFYRNKNIQEIKALTKDKRGSYILCANLISWEQQQVYAFLINQSVPTQRRYKQVLVPFGEYIPYPDVLKKSSFIQMHRSLDYASPQDPNPLFVVNKDTIMVFLCYEAFFESFMKKNMQTNPHAIFVLAREPFLGNKHYQRYSSKLMQIAAITFRKYIVRSSWGGNSCIIDTKGNIIKQFYNQDINIKGTIKLNNHITPFCRRATL